MPGLTLTPFTRAYSLFPSHWGEGRWGRETVDGFCEAQTAIGNAVAMTLYSQSVVINEIGSTCAPPSQDSIDHQRIPFNLRDEAKDLFGLWRLVSAERQGA